MRIKVPSLSLAIAVALIILLGLGEAPFSFSYSEGIDDGGYLTGIRALDYVNVANCYGISVPVELESLLTSYAPQYDYPTKDRAIAVGDVVNIDYVGSVGGVPFERGSTEGEGAFVIVGYTDYIEGFLEQLVGKMPGDEFDLAVTFPDNYAEELAGKDAVFATTVNYVVDTAALQETVWKDIADATIREYMRQYLPTLVEVTSLPTQMYEFRKNAMLYYFRENAKDSGMDTKAFIVEKTGFSGEDELIENYRESLEADALLALIYQAVAEDAGLSVSEADMDFFFGDEPNRELDEETFGLPYMTQYVLHQKAIEYVVGQASLTPAFPG